MITGKSLLIILSITILHRVNSASAVCEFSFTDRNKLYNFSLASPLPNFPHGILSEDGFYKVAVNDTVLWFQVGSSAVITSYFNLIVICFSFFDLMEQLCDGMIFNHDPPNCVDCLDCGGPSRCGMECSALVANNVGGYHVCTASGRLSSTEVDVIDKKNPHRGVIVKMSNGSLKVNCSLSVSVICELNGVQGPNTLEELGTCDYATVIWHPSGCATIISVHGRGWGWFAAFIIIILCLFGGYLLAGTVYRFFVLGVRSI
ncbi:LOW QUALITY PROTEIN: hypothetical protein CFOL_v3_32405, partial [Cephalotus follicularis]